MRNRLRRIAIDTSALVAMSEREDTGRIDWADLIAGSDCLVGTPTWLEFGIVMRAKRNGRDPAPMIHELQNLPSISTVPFDYRHFEAALMAHARFGKGTGHAAGLNFGDCLAYAIAKVEGVPLLFKGGDFAHTDVESALP